MLGAGWMGWKAPQKDVKANQGHVHRCGSWLKHLTSKIVAQLAQGHQG